MIWTFLVLLCVLATKFLTAVRLRGLKAQLEAGQPKIDELRFKLTEAEEQARELKLQVAQKSQLLNAMQDVVRNMEEYLKKPSTYVDALEREKLMRIVEKESSVT